MRTPGSGAYVGGTNAGRKQILHEGQIMMLKGDIVPGPDFPKLNIECKFYQDFAFHHLFLNERIPILESWITQLMDASDPGDLNLLLMKFNRKGKYVLVESKHSLTFNRFVCYNNWTFTDYDSFWTLNHESIKHLASK